MIVAYIYPCPDEGIGTMAWTEIIEIWRDDDS